MSSLKLFTSCGSPTESMVGGGSAVHDRAVDAINDAETSEPLPLRATTSAALMRAHRRTSTPLDRDWLRGSGAIESGNAA